MDYFTKWADAIPLCDQKTTTILRISHTVVSNFGMPEILHSDQGSNFESTLFHLVLDTFGITNVEPLLSTYHPQGDGMVELFNCLLLQLLRFYIDTEDN